MAEMADSPPNQNWIFRVMSCWMNTETSTLLTSACFAKFQPSDPRFEKTRHWNRRGNLLAEPLPGHWQLDPCR